jgi:hypothetical protein
VRRPAAPSNEAPRASPAEPISELRPLGCPPPMSANWDTPPLKRRRSGAAMLVPLAIVIGVGIVGMYVVRDVKHHGIGIAGPSPAQGLTNAVSGLNTTINALAVQAQLAQALDHSTTNYVQRISCTLRRSSGKGTEAARDRYLCVGPAAALVCDVRPRSLRPERVLPRHASLQPRLASGGAKAGATVARTLVDPRVWRNW